MSRIWFVSTISQESTTTPRPAPLVDLWRTEEGAAIECFVRSMRVAGAPDDLIAEAIRTRNEPRDP